MRTGKTNMLRDAKKSGARLSKDSERARAKPRRKASLRTHPRGHARRALGDAPEISPIARLAEALRAQETRFIVVGMTAALLQGAPATTLDIDLWIELPPRQYIRILNICRKLGGEVVANTVVVFGGAVTVNFLYRLDGLKSFDDEYSTATKMRWHGQEMSVLPLEKVYQSKKFIGRPKDIAVLPLLKRTIALRRKVK
jgi:hypothetical protein